MNRTIATTLLFLMLLSGFPGSFLAGLPLKEGRIIDESYYRIASPFALPKTEAAPRTKTIVFLVGSLIPTNSTSVATGVTSTYNFVISLPDMVPTAQPIRSAYIQYTSWLNTVVTVSASSFTLNKQSGTAQALAGMKLGSGNFGIDLLARLDATAAMRTLIGNASGTYAMTFTANLTGPTRTAEGAELYVTYDYDPFAPTQMNTAYQSVFSQAAQLSTANVTSTAFNFNLPESSPTTTFAVGASTTNQFWIEYRGFVSTSTSVSSTLAWNGEAISTTTFTQGTQNLSFLVLSPPKTAGISPNSANTFRMLSSIANGISAPNAIAIATYAFTFAGTTKMRRTLQIPLFQSTSTTAASTTINTTTTVNIPETSPSSTNAFLFGRVAFSTSSNMGINSFLTTSTCSVPAATAITLGTQQTNNAGFPTLVWNVTASSSIKTSATWNICSTFTRGANLSLIPGLMLFLSYDYANSLAAGARTAMNLSFLGGSYMTTSTATGTLGVNASIADASTTASYSWLDVEFDNNAPLPANQVLSAGIGTTWNQYTFPFRGTARRYGSTFTVTSSILFGANVTTTLQCSVVCIQDASLNFFGYNDVVAANLKQIHYHWRDNNGSESGSGALAPEDTATSTSVSTTTRLRIEITNAGDATSSAAFRIEYQKNATSGTWIQLATSTVGIAEWQMATSSGVTDGTATTNIATSTGGTTDANIFFDPGEVVASTSRNQAANNILSGTQFSEIEFALRPTANASTGVPYYFRLSNAGAVLTTYTIYPSMTVVASNQNPTVTGVVLNGGSNITLIPNTSTTVSVVASTTDPGGPGNIRSATSTIYRTGLGAACAANNQNCYQIASSGCAFSGSTSTVTCSANIWYFAQSTGNASASFPSDSWTGAITVTNGSGGTATATSSAKNVNVLTAINVAVSSISYGTLIASSTSGGANQTTTVQNAGNSSTTLQISGTALVNGVAIIATSSQHYATSSFAYGGSEQQLSGIPTVVAGFMLTVPTTTTAVQSNILWGIGVAAGASTGTYNATSTFTAVFSP